MFIRQKVAFDERNQLLTMTLSEIGERKHVEESFIGHRLRTFRMDVAQYYPFCT